MPLLHGDLSPLSPAECLAWDEAFLEAAESGDGGEALWFWESPHPFVVVGFGQSCAREADLDACAAAGIPVLRRCSGGGAVLQGPGCLNYGLVLEIQTDGPLASIPSTNRHVMERNRRALAPLLPHPILVRGHTDLVLATDGGERKFSGNAQRRRRQFLLFHGTLLLGLDLALMERCLRFPSLAPKYRGQRSHAEFALNTGLDSGHVREALRAEWQADPGHSNPPPRPAMEQALQLRYLQPDWHRCR